MDDVEVENMPEIEVRGAEAAANNMAEHMDALCAATSADELVLSASRVQDTQLYHRCGCRLTPAVLCRSADREEDEERARAGTED